MGIKDLPVDIISNVSSYLIGEPKDIRMKHNKALKQIQNQYKPEVNILDTHVGLINGMVDDEPFTDLYEDIILCVEPKIKTINYAMNLIPQQFDFINDCINESHLLYSQPDMKRIITIFVESLIEVKSRYCNETNTPYKRRVDYDIEEPLEIEDDLDEVLEMLKTSIEVEIRDNGNDDGILIHDISFTITIRIDTDEFQ